MATPLNDRRRRQLGKLAQAARGSIVRLTEEALARRWVYGSHLAGALLVPAGGMGLLVERDHWVVGVANPLDGWKAPYVPVHTLQLLGRVHRRQGRKVRVVAGGLPDVVYELNRQSPTPGRPLEPLLAAFRAWLLEGRHLKARVLYDLVMRPVGSHEEVSRVYGNTGGVPHEGVPDPPQPGELLYEISLEGASHPEGLEDQDGG